MSDLLNIKGIGEKKLQYFNKLGIYTVYDLITYYPRDYKDRSNITLIKDIKIGESYTLLCEIKQKPENITVNNKIVTKAAIFDESGEISAVWFNMPFMKNALYTKHRYFLLGKIEKRMGKYVIVCPEFEIYKKEESLSYNRIVPVYGAVKGLTQKAIRGAVKICLELQPETKETLPQKIIDEAGLCGKLFAIKNIHFPESNEAFLCARKRLCFEELFILQAALLKLKNKHVKETKGIIINGLTDYAAIFEALPYTLTDAQNNALSDIKSDMLSGRAMNRLIQGDVGSGKTAVALCASYFIIQNGYQAAIMAPTEVLAEQHYIFFSSVLNKLNICTVLLIGSLSKKEKDKSRELILSGDAQMVIGTHALIQSGVNFNKLGLVITDEQHRFGVKQRQALTEKRGHIVPHCLVMTATPIPRTLALILYGDLDISVIDTLPPGRKKIGTWAINSSLRKRLYTFLEEQIKSGRQVYVVCPAIEEAKENDTADISRLKIHVKSLKEGYFSKYNVSAVHGKMSAEEKREIMTDFVNGDIHILVSTTIIEVGVNVPNASVMVIENAERFGLSQLHQLRGRVGRGGFQSYCILISDNETETSKERLKAMTKTNSGFEISDMDLKIRGTGDFFGTKQHGLPELKIANLFKDIEILKEAQKYAKNLIDDDPYIQKEENALIAGEINMMFNNVTFGVYL